MPSKQVTDREKSVRTLTTAIDSHGGAVNTTLAAHFAPYLQPGETLPDLKLALQLVGRWVAGSHAKFAEADARHLGELQGDTGPRHERDVACGALLGIVSDLRKGIDANHGHEALRPLGLQDPLGTDPSAVAAAVGELVTRLDDPKVVLPPARRRGLAVDRKVFSEDLAAALPALQKALKDVASESSHATASQAAKDAAGLESAHVLSKGTALAHALFTAADKDGLFPRAPSHTQAHHEVPVVPDPAPNPVK